MVKKGDVVIYVDEVSGSHNALVTNVFEEEYSSLDSKQPGINIVFVSTDEGKEDPYGRQIERRTSVVYKDAQPAPGNYWSEVSSKILIL